MSLSSPAENEKGYLAAKSSFPHAFGGNPSGIRMNPRLKHSGVTVLRLIFEGGCVFFVMNDIS
jgi:hypothetical protein